MTSARGWSDSPAPRSPPASRGAHAATPAASPPARPKKVTPVTLPPGRLRLATRPSSTGSRHQEDDRNRAGGGFGRPAGIGVRSRRSHDPTTNDLGGKRGQSINCPSAERYSIVTFGLRQSRLRSDPAGRQREISAKAPPGEEDRSPVLPAARAPRAATRPPRRQEA